VSDLVRFLQDTQNMRKCRPSQLLSPFYNEDDEYRRGDKIIRLAKCLKTNYLPSHVYGKYYTTSICLNYYDKHVNTTLIFRRIGNSDYGQNFLFFINGYIIPDKNKPVYIFKGDMRRYWEGSKKYKETIKNMAKKQKETIERVLKEYKIPYHINNEFEAW
jgi:hypothetical protein